MPADSLSIIFAIVILLLVVLLAALLIFLTNLRWRLRELKDLFSSDRLENNQTLTLLRDSIGQYIGNASSSTEQRLGDLRKQMEEQLGENLYKKLDRTYNEVVKNLKNVHQSLGAVNLLADDMSTLRRLLSNVKVRGIVGETQLKALLTDILAPGQFKENLKIENESEFVEFAINLPAANKQSAVWIPVDAKFPIEHYKRLLAAREEGDKDLIDKCKSGLVRQIEIAAKSIAKKYIKPPFTSNFAIMFLATEGLFVEAISHQDLFEKVQREQSVMIAGPSTLSAMLHIIRLSHLNSMIENKATKVWKLFGEMKKDYQTISELLLKLKDKINVTSNNIATIESKLNGINKKLVDIEISNESKLD